MTNEELDEQINWFNCDSRGDQDVRTAKSRRGEAMTEKAKEAAKEDADGWSLPPFCNTDDLHSLVEHIEKLEAMLTNVQVVEGEVDSSEFVIENHAGKWREVIPVPGRTVTDSLLETYEALKESQP